MVLRYSSPSSFMGSGWSLLDRVETGSPDISRMLPVHSGVFILVNGDGSRAPTRSAPFPQSPDYSGYETRLITASLLVRWTHSAPSTETEFKLVSRRPPVLETRPQPRQQAPSTKTWTLVPRLAGNRYLELHVTSSWSLTSPRLTYGCGTRTSRRQPEVSEEFLRRRFPVSASDRMLLAVGPGCDRVGD